MKFDIVKQLREPPFGTETSERNVIEEAADEIARLRADLAAACELLKEARGYVFSALDGNCGPQVGLLARIDAALGATASPNDR